MKKGRHMSNESNKKYGIGLDVGTMNLICARYEGQGVDIQVMRDAFLDLEVESKKTLKMSQVDFIEIADQLIVLGEPALQMANLFKREVRRPLSKGLISPGELKLHIVLSKLVYAILDEARVTGEHCYYSVPAEPFDLPGQDVAYHTEVFRKIIEKSGYTAHPMNEAMAIIYSQCSSSNYSGLAISFGAGLCNVALSFKAMMGASFSIARGGGDWIDEHSAKAVGSTSSRMCSIKERGEFNLSDPPKDNPDAEAIALYVRNLIHNCLTDIAKKIRKDQSGIDLTDPIPIVLAGGTTLAKGFLNVFKEEFAKEEAKGFPLSISEIRLAQDQMNAVAQGLLVLANQEYD
jgi:hypothetical protein